MSRRATLTVNDVVKDESSVDVVTPHEQLPQLPRFARTVHKLAVPIVASVAALMGRWREAAHTERFPAHY